MRLEGKVAVVTGAGSGIGRASAGALAAEGATVVVSDIDKPAGAATVEAIEASGGRAAFIAADVGEHADCDALVAQTVADHGRLDILHANAGISLPFADGFTALIDPEAWDRVIRINLTGVFSCCRAAIPAMAAGGGGSIITTASSMATLPLGGMDAYAASKGGVALLTRSMAASAGQLGIRVNAICPGYVDTPLTSIITDDQSVRAAFARDHATGYQTPEEIGAVVAFLASDDARAFTGAVLTCDGGWTAFKRPAPVAELQAQLVQTLAPTPDL